MCIIIDTNKINDFFGRLRDNEAKPIHKWLRKKIGGGTMVYSEHGKYGEELKGNTNAKLQLESLSERGNVKIFNDEDALKIEEEKLKEIGCVSNDIPILALARAYGARLLYTADIKLMADFKNKDIINTPEGKIYSRSTHGRLLKRDMCSPQVKPTK